MKKFGAFFIVLIILIAGSLEATQRTVVLEVGVSACVYCSYAMETVGELSEKYPERLLVVIYDGSRFNNDYAKDRIDYYGMGGLPAAKFDGAEEFVGGDLNWDLPAIYDSIYQIRAEIEAPLEIELSGGAEILNPVSGSVSATITNTSQQMVEGNVLFTVTETDIPFDWADTDTVFYLERTMLPDAEGETIVLDSGETITVNREFTIDTTWEAFTNYDNIEFGCFVQGQDKEIYQGTKIGFKQLGIEEVALEFSIDFTELVTDRIEVSLALDRSTGAEITIFDALGSKVATIYKGELTSGSHHLQLDASQLSRGSYFIKADLGETTEISKLIVLN